MQPINNQNYWKAFMMPLETTLQRIVSFIPRLLVAFVVFLLFYAVAALARYWIRNALERVSHIPWAVRLLIARSVYILTILVGVLLALATANINVTTLVTSLGVAGFAIGFALKDILENFISGILLLFARPFEVGDQVTLGNFEGTVTDIQIRTTTLRTYNDEIVTMPNSSVYTNPVINHTRNGKRRYSVCFDTSLKADVEKVQREALSAVTKNSEVASEPGPFVRLECINSGTDTLSWRVFYWADPTKAVEIRTISSTIEHIKQSLFDAGVPTPSPSAVTILQSDPATPGGLPPNAFSTQATPVGANTKAPASNDFDGTGG